MKVVFFDGVCNLCNSAVNFIIDHDRGAAFRFAALQSPAAVALLQEKGVTLPAGDPDTILLLDEDGVHSHSTAALRIARHLGFPWSALYAFIVLPRFVRDPFYRFIAKNRYRWFGRQDACRMPTPELKARFL